MTVEKVARLKAGRHIEKQGGFADCDLHLYAMTCAKLWGNLARVGPADCHRLCHIPQLTLASQRIACLSLSLTLPREQDVFLPCRQELYTAPINPN
jgi:hypothetical protein